MPRHRLIVAIFLFLGVSLTGLAHVNSPDVYYDGYAGPYHLLATVLPPGVVPGVAEIQIRTGSGDIDKIEIVPLKMVGESGDLAPLPDVAVRSPADPNLYIGKLWIMQRGSWKVQVKATGKQGAGVMDVPLPAVSTQSAKMQTSLGILLAFLGTALVAGMVGIIGAASREGVVVPGQEPSAVQKRLSRVVTLIATVFLLFVVWAANRWWGSEAKVNANQNYKVPQVAASLLAGNLLRLDLDNPNSVEKTIDPVLLDRFKRGGMKFPDALVLNDLIADHGHLMHLFLVSSPDMKSFWHLHPDQTGEGQFTVKLPAIPAGHYQIYADIVHSTGFPETQIATIDLPGGAGTPLGGDDSGLSDARPADTTSQLSDGYRMVWERDTQPLKTNQPVWFRFRIEDKDGKVASGLEEYMGMAGHAAFISDDGQVFAHVHPAGSVSMAAVDLAGNAVPSAAKTMTNMPGMNAPVNGEVTFPYGFPRAGDYKIFVQVKRAGHIETGVFLAHVSN